MFTIRFLLMKKRINTNEFQDKKIEKFNAPIKLLKTHKRREFRLHLYTFVNDIKVVGYFINKHLVYEIKSSLRYISALSWTRHLYREISPSGANRLIHQTHALNDFCLERRGSKIMGLFITICVKDLKNVWWIKFCVGLSMLFEIFAAFGFACDV